MFPATSSEWTEQVKSDLSRLEIPQDLVYIESKNKSAFKTIVKLKTREFAFMNFMNKKETVTQKWKKSDTLSYRCKNI